MKFQLKAGLICLFYGGCSSGLSLVNKLLVNVYNFNHPLVVRAIQILVVQCVMNIVWFVSTQLVSFASWKHFSVDRMKACVVLSLVFLTNALFGLYAISRVSIPMFLAIRRLCALCIYVSDVCLLKKSSSWQQALGIVLISIGSLVAAVILTQANDLHADWLGYLLVLGNNVVTTAYLHLIRQLKETDKELGADTQTFILAVWSLPPLLSITAWVDPVNSSIFEYRSLDFYLLLAASGVLGSLLTISQTLCTTVNSPLTTSIVGNVKDVVLTLIGFLHFTDVSANPALVTGLVLSLTGAFIVSASKVFGRKNA